MNIDIDLIKKLQNTDDETLKATIRNIARSIGATDKQINNAVNSVGMIKKRMSNMSDAEIKRQVNKHMNKVDKDKAEEILKQLKL